MSGYLTTSKSSQPSALSAKALIGTSQGSERKKKVNPMSTVKHSVKESYIDSDLFRVLKNLQEKKFRYNNAKLNDIKFHEPADSGEADILVIGENDNKVFKIVIEAKRRQAKYSDKLDPYSVGVIGQALGYASALDAQFIATTNGDILVLFDALKKGRTLERQIGEAYKVKYTEEFASQFFRDVVDYLSGTLKLLPISNAFVERLKYFHELITPLVLRSLKLELKKNRRFQIRYKNWLDEQGFHYTPQTHQTISEQSAYLIMNRTLFHKTLEATHKELSLIPIKSQLDQSFDPESFIRLLERSFNKVVRDIDYGAVFKKAPTLDEIPISSALAEYLNNFVHDIEQYNLSEIKREVLGQVYESLIPKEERKRLGQYYTPPTICELICKLCITSTNDRILDPGCGSGGFLVSAYYRLLEILHKEKSDENIHNRLLNQIYGIDINQFAAHLAVINLTMRNLEAKTKKVNIICSDFFKILGGEQTTLFGHKALSIDESDHYMNIPQNFDVVVANPPYTRHEEIGSRKYKEEIRKIALAFNKKILNISAKAGIYAYFFTHSAHFLREHGLMGYIVSNSWMDVDFGKDLQKFFLDNFKIHSIIEFDKRAFEEAAINTVIVTLEKITGREKKNERDANIVRFVRIKRHLPIEEIIDSINKTNRSFENKTLRIILKRQSDLYKEDKWTKYLRAPEIAFKVLDNTKICQLKTIADISYPSPGKTGANDFFVLTREKAKALGIEAKYLKPIIISPREIKSLELNNQDISHVVLVVNEQKKDLIGKNVLKYIEYGEKVELEISRGSQKGKKIHGYQNVESIKNRDIWYSLGVKNYPLILIPKITWKKIFVIWNKDKILSTDNLYEINPKDKGDALVILGLLNSSLSVLFMELYGRTPLGEGALEIMVYEVEKLPIINPEKLNEKEKKDIENRFLGICKAQKDNNVDLEENARKALDITIFSILGLNENEIREIYTSLDELRSMREKRKETKIMIEEEV